MKHPHFLAAVAAALCASCSSPTRPETPDYFRELTGLQLCEEAGIRNRVTGPYDYEADFTYSVALKLDEECRTAFRAELFRLYKVDCDWSSVCNFMDDQNWYFEISRPIRDEQIFTMRTS